jgi:hypothetical protein
MILYQILERLAEMFPRQDYQSKLDRYISTKNPSGPGEIEQIIREYDQRNQRGFFQ